MSINLSHRINTANLTKKEREIAEYIIQNVNKTAFLSGIQLARETGVSATLITRFIQKLGYAKYSDFKIDMESLYKKTMTPYDVFQEFITHSNKDETLNHSIAQDLKNITRMQQLLVKETFDEVVNSIDSAKTVYLVAMFASEAVTQILSYHLTRLGKPFVLLNGVGISKKIEYSDITRDDFVICVSSQRILKEVRDVAVYCSNLGVKTVALTDSPSNPLATACDLFLLTPVSGSVYDYTLAAPIALANAIVNTLAAKHPDRLSDTLSSMEKRWTDKNLFCT